MQLSEVQQSIISHRGSDLQIIACAGAGKTESISRRVASLLADGVQPDSIVAFTFTEKAGAELKERIVRRTEDLKGKDFLDKLGPMFVGTIHGYCFHLLQDNVSKYGNYDVLDEHRHAGLLSREFKRLNLGQYAKKHWEAIGEWIRISDVAGNELMTDHQMEESGLGETWKAYREMLDRYHFLSFSMVIAKAVESLQDSRIFTTIHSKLKYLIVDEYQDINPAQEKLIELLAQKPVELCVVGDDDQAIYQWRGSDIENMISFNKRRTGVHQVRLLENRRSRPEIVNRAANFAELISRRLGKTIQPVRQPESSCVVPWKAETDIQEAQIIAETILGLKAQGRAWSDIAILFRSVRTSAPLFLEALKVQGIPFSAGGRTGLFMQPDINPFGELYAWMAKGDWREDSYGEFYTPDIKDVAKSLHQLFPQAPDYTEIAAYIQDWRSFYLKTQRPFDLVGDFYKLLNYLRVADQLDPDSDVDSARLGAFARFSTILADFENVTRRGRYLEENGMQVYKGGQNRGAWYLTSLLNYMLHYAKDKYEDFEGEDAEGTDAVQVLTVHQAKGLEWPIVFIPSLVEGRFPSKFSGKPQDWVFPLSVFPQEKRQRYEGSDDEERRLFYTALTRARDGLYLSWFQRKARAFKPSPYLNDMFSQMDLPVLQELPLPSFYDLPKVSENPPVAVSFSETALWEDCGFRYRLSSVFGFQQSIAEELGYGRALHHVLRHLAEDTKSSETIPIMEKRLAMLQREFYLPFADHPTFERMHRAATKLVEEYVEQHPDDLLRIWAIERPFELFTDDGTLSGRADVILDKEGGIEGRLAIVDYKVAKNEVREKRYEQQLQVYTHAGRREGVTVEAAYLHSLDGSVRVSVNTDETSITKAVDLAAKAMQAIRKKDFPARTTYESCKDCDYRCICRHCDQGVKKAMELGE